MKKKKGKYIYHLCTTSAGSKYCGTGETMKSDSEC